MYLQRVSARESVLTEDWYIRKPDVTKRSQRQLCQHIKKQSRWYWMPSQMIKQAQSEAWKKVNAVGHRVVHGGEKFAKSVVITDEVISAVEECNDLAPLHNPANLIGIRVCSELMPGVPQVAVFDTAFHQTMPEKAYMYGLPYEYYEKYKVRRYGFHGTSHSSSQRRQQATLEWT